MHKVIKETISKNGRRNMVYVTLYCACDPGRRYIDGARWQIGREEVDAAVGRARKKAEIVFRAHIPIR
jgi:hypothetical protein